VTNTDTTLYILAVRKRSETGALRGQGLSWIGMVLIETVSALCLDLG
jgi:hypothetical protein